MRKHGLRLLALLALIANGGVTAPLGAQTAAPAPPPAPLAAPAPGTEPSPDQPPAPTPPEPPAAPAAAAPAAAQPVPAEVPPAAETLAPATPAAAPRLGLFHRHPKGQAWVAAANPLAVQAGLEILARGGNAIDAAVAVQTMLGLVEPQSSGVAGGAFLMYYDAGSREVSALDGREKAPAAAPANMFLDEHGKPLPFLEAVRSGRSTGVPGVIAMLYAAHSKFGSMRWKELFQPAIHAAAQGFRVPARLAMFLGEGSPFPPTNEIRQLFSRPDGEPLEADDIFRNPEYAKTLERIAREGPRGFYAGPIAREIVDETHEEPLPGTMTLQDLASYRPEWDPPLCRPYRHYSVCAPPPPAGGVSLLELLDILEKTDIAARGPNDPQSWFMFAQASRLAYADRDRYVADPHYVPVPVERLLDPAYIKLRAQLIGEHAGPAPSPGEIALPRGRDATTESPGTSHFVVLDGDGNVVSMTTTIESVFGSGRTVGGFVLNNQLTDFSFAPTDEGHPIANAVHGGKRPRSSMAPVIVLDHDGNFVTALGSPGGGAITEYNAKALVGLLAWRMTLKQAIELPNLIARGDSFTGELAKFTPEVLAGLRERGMLLKLGRAENSGLHGVVRLPDGTYQAAADSRREGTVGVLEPRPAKHHATAH
ncbi:MAG TPA: gamma-glutamyltransferase [Steroidobacteraceae bacterium]|nr:gamma-glutamyltransferase [Steroidobacteraceae bacterium]